MAMIQLRKVPDDIHRQIKRMQLDREDKGEKISLEDIYMELIRKALEQQKTPAQN